FLYNLALTYRALGQPAKAIENYEGYLRDSPNATDRATVEAAIVEEKRKLATSQTAKSDSGSEGAPFYKKWWFWTATGAAVLALGVGLGVGLSRPTTATYREVTWQ
ncbi:MAG TPA: tetratricopeptide repeat protein, partial [Pseudomonadota bacterium]|nr:tetratricopeptide repeat protein [Pseudomonadota bacterium]